MSNIMKINNREISAVPTKALALVEKRLPELMKKTEAFNRQNSQTTLNMMSLTMMNGQSPMRQIRQTLAEIETRQCALMEAQVRYAKLTDPETPHFGTNEIEKAESRLHDFNVTMLETKIGGVVKDIANLISTYDKLVELNDVSDWSEEDYERSEAKHHVRRGFELLYHNLVESQRPGKSAIEYLQQFGVHIQIATKEVAGYMMVVEALIESGTIPLASHLEDFLDEMSDKYAHCVADASKRMFGSEDMVRPDFMSNWKK